MVKLFTVGHHHIYKESSIILVSNSNSFSIITLFNKVHLDVGTVITLLEPLLIGLETVSLNLKMLILLVNNSDGTLGIIGDDHIDDIEGGIDGCSKSEILEKVSIFVEILQASDVG